MDFTHYVPLAARFMEVAGIIVMIAGPLFSNGAGSAQPA